jgi:hypothetical protein
MLQYAVQYPALLKTGIGPHAYTPIQFPPRGAYAFPA